MTLRSAAGMKIGPRTHPTAVNPVSSNVMKRRRGQLMECSIDTGLRVRCHASQLDRFHQLLHVVDAGVEHLSLGIIHLDLDDALDAAGPKDAWHADKVSADA